MSDKELVESKPSDVVGTDREYKRVEQTLPEQKSSKGLQPIIPTPSGNAKTSKTIGSMTGRKEKTIQDIQSIGKTEKKEINNIVTPTTREEKQNSNLENKENREYKNIIDISTSSDRSIKHKELEKAIQRISKKQDSSVSTEQNHEQKNEESLDVYTATSKKTENEFNELNHSIKTEQNIFDNIDHKKRVDVESDDININLKKEEVETSISSTGLTKTEKEYSPQTTSKKTEKEYSPQTTLEKTEVDIPTDDFHDSKTEKEYSPQTTLEKTEVEPVMSNVDLNKTEIPTLVNNPIDTPKNSNETKIENSGGREDKEWEQTTGNEYFPSLQKDSKEYNTTLGEKNLTSDRSNKEWEQTTGNEDFISLQKNEKTTNFNTTIIEKESERDFDPSRNLKAGIDGIDAESVQEPSIVSNYKFVSPPPEGYNTTKKLNNLEYTDIMAEFTDALNNSVKTGDKETEDMSEHILDQDSNLNKQQESDHLIGSLSKLNRKTKTQDIYSISEPKNTSERLNEDRTDLSSISIDEELSKTEQIESIHDKRQITFSNRNSKIDNTADLTPVEPNNTSERLDEDRTTLDINTLEGDSTFINTESIDFNKRDLGPVERNNKGTHTEGGGKIFSNSASEPIITSSASDDKIAYRPDTSSLRSNIRGINLSTLYSFMRPIGFLRKLNNNKNSSWAEGDTSSVMFNSMLPLINEGQNIPSWGGNIVGGLSDIIKGSDALIPLTPTSNSTAGNTTDDLLNYARHAAIQGFRVLANNVIDNLWLMGTGGDSDTQQAKNNSPGGAEQTAMAETIVAVSNLGDLKPASTSQNLRGQIATDANSFSPYSTKSISKSPAHMYKSFGDYIQALRAQIVGNNVLSFFSSHDAVTDKAIEKKIDKNIRGASAEQKEQMKRMYEQLITFESKLYRQYDKNGNVYDSDGYIKKGDEYEDWIRSQRKYKGDFKYSDFSSNPEETYSYPRTILSTKKTGANELVIDSSDTEMRTLISQNFEYGKRMTGSITNNLTSILDSTGEDRHYVVDIFHDGSMSEVYSHSVVGENTKDIKIDYKLTGEKINTGTTLSDPHLQSAFISSTNKGNTDDYVRSARNIKRNFISEMLKKHSEITSVIAETSEELKGEDYNHNLFYGFDSDNPGYFSKFVLPDWQNKIGPNNESFSELVHTDTLNITTPATALISNKKYENEIRSAKDIWLNYGEKYDITNSSYGLVDGRDRSTSLLQYNIQNFNTHVHPEIINNEVLREYMFSENNKETIYNYVQIKDNYRQLGKLKTWGKTQSDLGTGADFDNMGLLLPIKTNIFPNGDPTLEANIGSGDVKDFTWNKNSESQQDSTLDNTNAGKYSSNGVVDLATGNTDLGKKVLNITEFHDDQKKLQFSKDIFVGALKDRHNLQNRKGKDEEWKRKLYEKMQSSLGNIIVNPNPTLGGPHGGPWVDNNGNIGTIDTNNTLYTIPFQFNPELTSESRQASWSSHSGYGRTNEFYIWNNTSSRQINFKTVYIATDDQSTSSMTYKSGDSFQYPDISFARIEGKGTDKNTAYNFHNSGFGAWSPAYIHKIVEKYRSLVIPMDMSNPDLAVPPIIIIDFNNQFVRFTNHSKKTFARWIVEDVAIEPIIELGYTASKFPFGYEISLTLKEIFDDWGDYQDIRSGFIDHAAEFIS